MVDKFDLTKPVIEQNFIPDIDKYCDEWCERCAFTDRCEKYATHEMDYLETEENDVSSEVFWEKFTETLQTAKNMLSEIIEREGIDLNTPEMDAMMAEEQEHDDIAWEHECSQDARAYTVMVKDWFDAAKELFDEKRDQLVLSAQLELPNVNPVAEVNSIQKAIDVINWYQMQISIKTIMAVRRTIIDKLKSYTDFPRDPNGYAKVALIGIDRSITAWGTLREHFSDREDEILDILICLDRLRKKIENTFPGARAFVRPGLDEIEP